MCRFRRFRGSGICGGNRSRELRIPVACLFCLNVAIFETVAFVRLGSRNLSLFGVYAGILDPWVLTICTRLWPVN